MSVNPTGKNPVSPPVQNPPSEPAREPTADMVRDGLDSLFEPPGSFHHVDSSVQDIIGGRGQKVAANKENTSFSEIAKAGVEIGKPTTQGQSGQIAMSRAPGQSSIFSGGSRENAEAAMAHGGLLKLSRNKPATWQPRLADSHRTDSPRAYSLANSPSQSPQVAKGPQAAQLNPTNFGVHDFDMPRGPFENMSQSLNYGLSLDRYGVFTPYDGQ